MFARAAGSSSGWSRMSSSMSGPMTFARDIAAIVASLALETVRKGRGEAFYGQSKALVSWMGAKGTPSVFT